jgi:LmbE family N-acetylglucosaminyl deacetylase
MRHRSPAAALVLFLTGTGFSALGPTVARADDTCAQGTVMNIVAHQDDDILFQSPDLLDSIREGQCVRTVYITAGDDGQDERGGTAENTYWGQREKGARAAYESMTTIGRWDDAPLDITTENGVVPVHGIKSQDARIGLSSLRLPDGNVSGQGYSITDHQTLQKMMTDGGTMIPVDKKTTDEGAVTFTTSVLQETFRGLMRAFHADTVRLQDYTLSVPTKMDHSDHAAGARIAKAAYDLYQDDVTYPTTVVGYRGYSVYTNDYPVNVVGDVYEAKKKVFAAYAAFDTFIDIDPQTRCTFDSLYCLFLEKQYKVQ